MKFFRRFARIAVCRRGLDDRPDERVELDARTAHPDEVRQHQFKLQPPCILDNHVEEFGHRRRRRLHLLAQESRQSPAEPLL